MEQKQVMERKTPSKELYLISCGYEKCQPGQFYGPGIRRYYVIHFVLSGQGHYYMGDRHFLLSENQCFLIPPDLVTLYRAEASSPWEYVWVCFHGGTVPILMEHCLLTKDSPTLQISDIYKYKYLILEMMEYAEVTPANDCYIQSLLYRLVAMLEEQAGTSYSDFESNDNLYIAQAIDYIQNCPYLDITVGDVAKHLHISRSYLFELFKRHLDNSPQTFLTSAKIANARELLSGTDISVANIATSSGYKNAFSFSRAFKKQTGMTPSEYREKHSHNEQLLDN